MDRQFRNFLLTAFFLIVGFMVVCALCVELKVVQYRKIFEDQKNAYKFEQAKHRSRTS
jgi:hypothetical protein